MAVIRRIPRYKLAQIYPEFAADILKQDDDEGDEKNGDLAAPFMSYENNREQNWEDNTYSGVRIIEYYDMGGTYVVFLSLIHI